MRLLCICKDGVRKRRLLRQLSVIQKMRHDPKPIDMLSAAAGLVDLVVLSAALLTVLWPISELCL